MRFLKGNVHQIWKSLLTLVRSLAWSKREEASCSTLCFCLHTTFASYRMFQCFISHVEYLLRPMTLSTILIPRWTQPHLLDFISYYSLLLCLLITHTGLLLYPLWGTLTSLNSFKRIITQMLPSQWGPPWLPKIKITAPPHIAYLFNCLLFPHCVI